jgi:very-short-patch-repair endonuclease
MPTTTEIISTHQTKINQRIEAYISEYLNLCETEIERLFLSSLLYYYFNEKFSFGYSTETSRFEVIGGFSESTEYEVSKSLFSFTNLIPTYIINGDEGFENVNRKIIYEDLYKYKLIGFQFSEKNTNFVFLPQHVVDIEGQSYRLDFALYYLIDGEEGVKSKIAIECDGFEHHQTKEQQINDAIRSRKLTLNGWKIYRMTGTEINQNSDITSITKIIKELRHLCRYEPHFE